MMGTIKKSLFMITALSYSCLTLAQTASLGAPGNTNKIELDQLDEPVPNYTVAQIVPAYKIAIKKGMFEVAGGLGHVDQSKQATRGQAQNVKQNPQTDYLPFQMAYAFSDNFYIAVAGRAIRTTDRVANTSLEGTSEPQFSASYAFRNSYSVLLLTGTYNADIGPKTEIYKGASRMEGNTLTGGASGELQGGYYARLGPAILGGEISYLYKDSRIVNTRDIAPYTAYETAPTQDRLEGGAEKSLRAVAELATSFRLGVYYGRTWIEQEDYIRSNQFAPFTNNSYFKDTVGAYGRIQVHPRLSVLPLISVSEAPDTSGQSNQSTHEIQTQISLRFRF